MCVAYMTEEGQRISGPLPLISNDFENRTRQTERLMRMTPILQDIDGPWLDEIAAYVGAPVVGHGDGPKTSDGVFVGRHEWQRLERFPALHAHAVTA
jgi:hypothetical protein